MTLTELIEQSSGKFIRVRFVKKDGTVRKMLCRLGVSAHLKGGTSNLSPLQYITVYDVQKRGYRAINRATVLSVTVGGVSWLNVPEGDEEPTAGYVNQ